MNKKPNQNKKMKKILGILIFTFAIVGFASAAYLFGYDKTVTGFVVGGEDNQLIIQSDFSDYTMNVSDNANESIQTLILYNENGDMNMSLELNVSKALGDQSCNNYESDCSIILNDRNGILSDGDNVSLIPGYTELNLTTSCVKRSCPQNITTEIILTEI